MTRSTILKKREKELRLAKNSSRKVKINVKRGTHLPQNVSISDKDQSKNNEQLMYETPSFSDPSCQKLSNNNNNSSNKKKIKILMKIIISVDRRMLVAIKVFCSMLTQVFFKTKNILRNGKKCPKNAIVGSISP